MGLNDSLRLNTGSSRTVSKGKGLNSRSKKVIVTLILGLALGGCSLFGDDEDADEFAGLSTEEQFYERALEQLNGQNFRGAISTYQALESRFPFGRFAAQSQIEIV